MDRSQRRSFVKPSTLELTVRHGIYSIAFPLISAGIYGYPVKEAAAVAIETITEFLADHDNLDLKVLLVCRGWDTYEQVMSVFED